MDYCFTIVESTILPTSLTFNFLKCMYYRSFLSCPTHFSRWSTPRIYTTPTTHTTPIHTVTTTQSHDPLHTTKTYTAHIPKNLATSAPHKTIASPRRSPTRKGRKQNRNGRSEMTAVCEEVSRYYYRHVDDITFHFTLFHHQPVHHP